MNKEQAFAAFLLPLLFFMIIGKAQAQTVKPGVSPGNVFTYDFSVFWSSTNPNATLPADLVELNKTETIRITITQVSGSVVFMKITSRFENGTESIPQEGMVDILSGSGVGAFGLIVSPNLGAHNVVYPSGNLSFTINETATRTYLIGERETAHYTANSTDEPDFVYVFKELYFDRTTGVMLEGYTEQVQSSSPNEKRAILWKIKEFNLSTIVTVPDYWPLIVAVVSVIAVLIAGIVFMKKRRKRRRKRRK